MSINAKSELKFHFPHKTTILPSLIVVVLVCSLFVCVFANHSIGTPLADAIHVKNEDELKNTINNAPTGKPTTITIDNDITLTSFTESNSTYNYHTGMIIIPANKDITLTSNRANGYYKLISTVDIPTILVGGGGVLRIDGIIVTHKNGITGQGIQIMNSIYDVDVDIVDTASKCGTLYLYSGEISGNTHKTPFTGAGVSNTGIFIMSGGKITGNTAGGHGGGVHNSGVFKMTGGEISGNTATSCGGGVYMKYYGSFTMSGGTISGNTAAIGGGVFAGLYSDFTMSGGKITGNKANNDGGGVYNDGGTFEWLSGTITDNIATNIGNNVYPDGIYPSDNDNLSDGFFSLKFVIICVGVIVLVAIIIAVLIFTSKKQLDV